MEREISRLEEKLSRYVEGFNSRDEELNSQAIPNKEAAAYLLEQIPLLDCPDPELEEIYYFRWWTFRKHWKATDKGHILTEFLPQVPWSGPYNSINCGACLHIREGRWLADPENWLKEYIDFWLEGHGDGDAYSAWYAHAVWEYCALRGDFSYGVEKLPALVVFFERREAKHRRNCGLYWSNDDRDGMEYSISGPGLRPTINSYACADAAAISRLAEIAGEEELSRRFARKAEELKQKIDDLLWDGNFYKTIPAEERDTPVLTKRPEVAEEKNARELVGYLPWYFCLPPLGREGAFDALLRQDGFAALAGLTTAERCHPRFMEEHDHECLWNGPVWPYATSQTLVAVSNLLRHYRQNILSKEDYYRMLLQYARSQHRMDSERKRIPWIDEKLDPFTGRWLSRDILESWGWKPEVGGYERGKDYNHSLFCDLVLSGLLGIGMDTEGLMVKPLIPDSWDYFWVENVSVGGKRYRIVYDKDGSHYGAQPGITVQQIGR